MFGLDLNVNGLVHGREVVYGTYNVIVSLYLIKKEQSCVKYHSNVIWVSHFAFRTSLDVVLCIVFIV